ncbi:MAG TPA: nucleotide sugar dehydrogenase [Candidatus Babeliales bacterium]|nr:nucleotide sugar dehydrogenase [Candidatus Babeliales bacterium]
MFSYKFKINILLLLLVGLISESALGDNLSVIGIGRLGICSALCFERAGYKVLGMDVMPAYVKQINNKTLKSTEPLVEEYLQSSKNFKATTSLDEVLNFSDTCFIVVPTPTSQDENGYDHSILTNLLTEINKRQVRDKHFVICCTIFPGYIRDTAQKILSDCVNCSISYNPEFIAQGTIIHDTENPDVILVGEASKEAGEELKAIYNKVCRGNYTFACMTPDSAEITKLTLNCFVTTRIAFINMIGDLADLTPNADKYDILRTLGQYKRIGVWNRCLRPGYGYGGPCLPRDNRTLGLYIKQKGLEPLIPVATDESNKFHALFMAHQLLEQDLDEYVFEDVNYKDNCSVVILEESQKLVVAKLMVQFGKKVIIKDRRDVIQQVKQEFGDLFEYVEAN